MKIERETDRDYQRWSIETHQWVDKSAVAVVGAALAGVIAIISGIARIFGWG